MCEITTIAALALSAASAAANSAAQSRIQKARDQSTALERMRQQKLDQEADVLNEGSRNRYQDFGGQQDKKASQLAEFFNEQNLPTQDTPEVAPPSGSGIVVQEQQKQRGKAREFSNQQGEALGNLRAFGDLLGGIGRLQARDASKVGQIGKFKQDSSNALAYELEAANHKGDGMKMFGDILGGLGSVVGMAGGGMFGSAGGAAAPSMAVGSAPGTLSVTGLGSSMPSAPLRIGTSAASLPTFARPGSFYRYF